MESRYQAWENYFRTKLFYRRLLFILPLIFFFNKSFSQKDVLLYDVASRGALYRDADIVAHVKVIEFSQGAYWDWGTPLLYFSFEIVDVINYNTLRLDSLIDAGLDSNQILFNRSLYDTSTTICYEPAVCLPSRSRYTILNFKKDGEYIVFFKSKTLQWCGSKHQIDKKVIVGVAYGHQFYATGIFPFSTRLKNELSDK